MKRRLFKLALFLLLGAVVNVAVAWGIATWVIVLPDIMRTKMIEQRTVKIYTWNEFGVFRILAVPDELMKTDNRLKLMEALARLSEMEFKEIREVRRVVVPSGLKEIVNEAARSGSIYEAEANGWPFLTLRWSAKTECFPKYLPNEPRHAIHIVARNIPFARLPLDRLIPLFPIWPGFAINTIFYAALLWLLTLGPFTARRMIRRKRGCCLKCGYDLRGKSESGCPECGWGRSESSEKGGGDE